MMELRAENVSQDFLRDSAREGYIVAVAETNLCLSPGTVTAVMGHSGSGKSTLLHIMGGLLPPVTGKVFVGATDLYALSEDARAQLRSSSLGVVPQQLMSLCALTVRENVLLSALLYGREQDVSTHADALMERLGIAPLAHVYPSELSGGELRRMMIARALAGTPQMLLLDEPTGDLDAENTRRVLDLVRETADAGAAVLLVTHEREAASYADVCYTMAEGRLTHAV
ncbi:ATP-binding cassette domain-containing protein [uncultured Selenomonas sp.]|uniref:ABC transporter ATP-binding protein n=1 Tax=uncultured Selenomonas sp. TaxID=159275 RepID=UPI0028E8A325|nr:ATP-binding cassette domain-containing protein [uncultured Selenomonas sp.]